MFGIASRYVEHQEHDYLYATANKATNIVLQVLKNLNIKAAGSILKVIDGIKIYVDNIGPSINRSLEREYYHTIPFHYEPVKNSNGYMDRYGVWHPI